MSFYNHKEIEPKWQGYWAKHHTFKTGTDVSMHPTKQEVRISKERELMALLSEAISNSLKEQALIPDALENLAKSTVRNRQKVEQTILPLKENTLYYEQTEVTRPTQVEVSDHQVGLTEERQDLTLFAKETLDQLTKPAKLHFAERKPASYDQLDHPGRLDLLRGACSSRIHTVVLLP